MSKKAQAPGQEPVNPYLSRLFGRKFHGCARGCWASFDHHLPEVGQMVDASTPRGGNVDVFPMMTRATFLGLTEAGEVRLLRGQQEVTQPVAGYVWHATDYDTSRCCALALTLKCHAWSVSRQLGQEGLPAVEDEGVETQDPTQQEEATA